MANNRMYLAHPETGAAVFIAKRMGGEWYMSDEQEGTLAQRLAAFFDEVGAYDDAIVLAMEDEDRMPKPSGLTISWESGAPRVEHGEGASDEHKPR